jgi:hypothetical protein
VEVCVKADRRAILDKQMRCGLIELRSGGDVRQYRQQTGCFLQVRNMIVSRSLQPLIPLRLSQTQLNLLATCPRKFQHLYLEQLAAPPDVEQQERLSQGSQFHLLMQQWQLGLPIEPLLHTDESLQRWFRAFEAAAPEILTLPGEPEPPLSQSEHTRTLEFEGYLLTVVYDLLMLGDRSAKILDWKTYPRPRQPKWLLQNWQTRLYPFVLAETSLYAPAQISMVYWFFQSSESQETSQGTIAEPQSLTLVYDSEKHEQTRRNLRDLLNQLTGWLQRYENGEPLLQVRVEEQCSHCNFAVRCFGTPHLEDTAETQPLMAFPTLAEIQEVPL